MSINITPDKKLFTKHIYTLLTISFVFSFIGLIFQIFIPFNPKITSSEAAIVIWPIVVGMIIIAHLIALPLLKLWVNNLTYLIKTDRVVIKKGIISKIEQNIPFSAITDFALHRSLYDRILGIASIRIQTAGQSANPTGYEGCLSGLKDFDKLYKELRDKLKFNKGVLDPEQNKLTNFSTPDLLTKILMELTTMREIMEREKK